MANKQKREDELAELDEKDERQRARMLRQTTKDVLAVIANADGLKRLKNITDEEWQDAVERDAGTGTESEE